MSKRDVRLFLHEMLEAIHRISSYIAGMDYAQFEQTTLVQDGVIRNPIVVGEAARYASEELRARYPEIPWRQIIGFRNIVIHAYFAVDLPSVWRICSESLTELEAQIDSILSDLGPLASGEDGI